MWARSGVPALDELFARGVAAMEASRLAEAEEIFSQLVERAPDFAEGWNKRATVRYLRHDYQNSIADCRATLARKAHHFGALSGQGLCHLALGQVRDAAELFRRALEVHPHLTAVRRNLHAATAEAVKGNGIVKGSGTASV
jgi:tetratricopeptide (TPR) repeat protein